MRKHIESLISSGLSAYKISKETGIPNNTVVRIIKGEASLDNITLKNAEILSKYWEDYTMKKENMEEIKGYLSRTRSGSLIVDTADGKVEWSTDSDAISHGTFVVVEQYGVEGYCDCGEPFNEECEQCQDQLNDLLERIESILKNLNIQN